MPILHVNIGPDQSKEAVIKNMLNKNIISEHSNDPVSKPCLPLVDRAVKLVLAGKEVVVFTHNLIKT